MPAHYMAYCFEFLPVPFIFLLTYQEVSHISLFYSHSLFSFRFPFWMANWGFAGLDTTYFEWSLLDIHVSTDSKWLWALNSEHLMQISMSVLWILIYVPMEFVKIYVVVTVVIATVAMSQMPLEETVLVSYLFYYTRAFCIV